MKPRLWVPRWLNTVVLCYHRVIPPETARRELVHRALYVTPEAFERHLLWMQRNGTIVPYREVFDPKRGIKFVITFDDGWMDNHRYVYPLAEKYGIPLTIFLSSKNIDEGRLFWSEEVGVRTGKARVPKTTILGRLAEVTTAARACQPIASDRRHEQMGSCLDAAVDLAVEELKLIGAKDREELLEEYYREIGSPGAIDGRQYLLGWDEVREMSRGSITFGSHTHTHAFLDRIESDAVDDELGRSKELIEAQVGKPVDALSYPNGLFRREMLRDRLSAHGYRFAFTLERDLVQEVAWHAIPRWLVYQGRTWRPVTAKALARLVGRKIRSEHRWLRPHEKHQEL